MKLLNVAISKSISIFYNLSKDELSSTFGDFGYLLQKLNHNRFQDIREIQKFSELLRVTMTLFESNEISFHVVFEKIKKFVESKTSLKPFKELFGIIQLLVNTYRKQIKSHQTKLIYVKVNRGLEFLE